MTVYFLILARQKAISEHAERFLIRCYGDDGAMPPLLIIDSELDAEKVIQLYMKSCRRPVRPW